MKRTQTKELLLCTLLLALCGGMSFAALHQARQQTIEAERAPVSRTVRIAAPKQEQVVSSLSPYGTGFEQDIASLFSQQSGLDIEWVDVAEPDAGWQTLKQGQADVFISLGYWPPESLSDPIVAGPAYAHYKPMLVREKSVKTCDAARNAVCPKPVLVTASPSLERGLAEDERIQLPEDKRIRSDERMNPLLNSLHVDAERLALVDHGRFKLWQPFYQRLRPSRSVGKEAPYRWYWRRADETLDAALTDFWLGDDTQQAIRELTEKYFGFLPAETDYYELRHFSRTISIKLPKYQDMIIQAANEYGLDPLFLIAIIYQESHFDPSATSKTMVRGLMQLTEGTARMMGIQDRTDPAQSIQAGAKYLRALYDDLAPLELSEWDRWFFALAAYNQGPGHLYDAVKLSRRLGGHGQSWTELKETFPLLAWEKYYSQVKHGYTRGFEAVDYVESIRYYYYVLHGLVALARPEAEHLAPLLSAVPGAWPNVS